MVKDHVRGARGGACRPPVHRLARWDGWCRGAAGGGTPAPSAMTPAAGSAVSASLPRSRWGSPTLLVGEHLLHNDAGESTSVPPRPSLPLLSPSLQRRIGPLEGPSPQVPDWQAAMLAASHPSHVTPIPVPPASATHRARRGATWAPETPDAEARGRPPRRGRPIAGGRVARISAESGEAGGGRDEGGRDTGRGAGRDSAGRPSGWRGVDAEPVEGRPEPGGGPSGRARAASNQHLCPVGAPPPPG